MNDWLKSKTAGLPRWAWVALLGGGLAVGLYLRSRSTAEPEEEEPEIIPEGSLSAYEGTEQGAGLAAAGLVGPAAGQVVPVETPMLPAGITDIIEQQQETIRELGRREPQEPSERVETIREVEGAGGSAIPTGGGAPNNARKQQAQQARQKRVERERAKANKEVVRLSNEIRKLETNIQQHPKAKKRKGWEAQIRSKKQTRNKWQAKVK